MGPHVAKGADPGVMAFFVLPCYYQPMAVSSAGGSFPHRNIIKILRTIPTVDAQNRLLRLSDKDLALSLLYMSEEDRQLVYRLLGEGKSNRVKDELRRQEHSRIAQHYYEAAVRTVIRNLEGANVRGPRSYYRPRTPRS